MSTFTGGFNVVPSNLRQAQNLTVSSLTDGTATLQSGKITNLQNINGFNTSYLANIVSPIQYQIDQLVGNVYLDHVGYNFLAGQIQDNANSIAVLDTSMGLVTSNITTISNTIAGINSNNTVLTGIFAPIISNVTALQSNVATLQGNITTLTGNISTQASQISALQSNVSIVQGNITSINSPIGNIKSNITSIVSNVATLESTESSIQVRY